jgi:hypothetical protein
MNQPDEKLIEQNRADNEPIELGSLRVKGVRVRLGHAFSASTLAGKGGGSADDWLDNLEFRLTNLSDKKVTFVRIVLLFPETADSGRMLVYDHLGVGNPPVGRQSQDSVAQVAEPFSFNPGSTITWRLSQEELDQIKQFLGLGHFQLSSLTKLLIKINYVIFDDGTKWELGHRFKPTPNGPRPWEKID